MLYGSMTPEELRTRTKRFAARIIRMHSALPRTPAARIIGDQVLRSATSVGANYRAACRARSRAEFIAKLGIVVEEAEETVYWLESSGQRNREGEQNARAAKRSD